MILSLFLRRWLSAIDLSFGSMSLYKFLCSSSAHSSGLKRITYLTCDWETVNVMSHGTRISVVYRGHFLFKISSSSTQFVSNRGKLSQLHREKKYEEGGKGGSHFSCVC